MTHGGETLSLAAAAAVLDTIADGSVLAGVEELGTTMLTGLRELVVTHGLGDRVRIGGEPPRTVVAFAGPDHLAVRSWVQQVLVEHGCLFNGSMFICARHTAEEVDMALAAFDEAFKALAEHGDVAHLLRGPPVQAVFRAP